MSLITSRANNGRNPDVVGLAGTNLTSSDIAANNRIVARWTGSTNTVGRLEADENQIGVQLPDTTNNRILGVLQLNASDQVLSPNEDAPVIRGGRARLWVKVPANINLPKGTGLVPAMNWDSTNHVAYFGTSLVSSVAQNVGYAEAVVKGAGIYQPANPIAWLSKALTATASDTFQLAEVEVDYNHKPIPLDKRIFQHTGAATNDVISNLTNAFAFCPLGPFVVTGMAVQGLTAPASGKLTVQLNNCPNLATADTTAMLSTALTIDSAGSPSNGAILVAGAGGSAAPFALDGDTDTAVAYGTTGSNGVLAAIGKRTLISGSILSFTISGSPGGSASALNASIDVFGYYL